MNDPLEIRKIVVGFRLCHFYNEGFLNLRRVAQFQQVNRGLFFPILFSTLTPVGIEMRDRLADACAWGELRGYPEDNTEWVDDYLACECCAFCPGLPEEVKNSGRVFIDIDKFIWAIVMLSWSPGSFSLQALRKVYETNPPIIEYI